MRKQQFYPTPPTSVKPDFWDRPPSLSVSPKTAGAQQDIINVISGDSEYTRQYSTSTNESKNADPSCSQGKVRLCLNDQLCPNEI